MKGKTRGNKKRTQVTLDTLAQMVARGFEITATKAETATKEDVRALGERVDDLGHRIDGIDNRVHALEQTVAEVLRLMREDRKERVAEIVDLQIRVAQIEKKVNAR